jgi:AcrR family transcriptional regulator
MKRAYNQTARAEATQATRRRIAQAFVEASGEHWFDDITLEEIARRAGVTVRTVIRQFGGKEGLVASLAEVRSPQVAASRTVTPGDITGAINRLFENYERDGDGTIRVLGQETRYPQLDEIIAVGRAGHRNVTAANFAPWLDRLPPDRRDEMLDALVIATDIYTWKLLRRDMGRSVDESKATIRGLVEGVLLRFASEGCSAASPSGLPVGP